jgi:hypothetical protein
MFDRVHWILRSLLGRLFLLALVSALLLVGLSNNAIARVRVLVHQRAALEAELPSVDEIPNPFKNPALLPPVANPSIGYTPPQRNAPADPTNYDQRVLQDADGNLVSNPLIVVLHETVGTAQSAIYLFQTYHPDDWDQVSYHVIIERDGTVVYIVPIEMRAFGAGNSVFVNHDGRVEGVRTNPAFPPSVNNFAYHISLESPPGSWEAGRTHRGYTEAQYQSLAWLLARTDIPDDRITTHEAVDRSESRMDPRSFNRQHFLEILHQYPNRRSLS